LFATSCADTLYVYGPAGGTSITENDQFVTVCWRAIAFPAKTRRRASSFVTAAVVGVAGMSTLRITSTMTYWPTTEEFTCTPPSVETTRPALVSPTVTFSDRSGTLLTASSGPICGGRSRKFPD